MVLGTSRLLTLLVLLVGALALPAVAQASDPAWPTAYTSVSKNPADALAELPIEDSAYDPATKCSAKPKAGMTALVQWLRQERRRRLWGTYRCEKWGKGSASLHAEGRAVDWHLDVDVPADRREAERLIRAPARARPHRRAAGARAPHGRRGDHLGLRVLGGRDVAVQAATAPAWARAAGAQENVDKTTAHRDHLHIGMTKAGAAKKTSFWTRRAAT